MFTRQPFSTSAIREAGRLVIRLCGPLTFRGGAADKEWGAQLDSAAGTDVALDLSCVTDLDARGVGMLAEWAGRALQRGRRVSVAAASAVSERLAVLTGLDKALPGEWHRRSRAAGTCCY